MASTGYFLKGVDNFDISGYPVGTTRNLGISYSAGVFKIVQADGSDLSTGISSGQVVLPHTTAGRSVALNATSANHKFQDASHASDSDIIGEYFGTDTGVAWSFVRPFYLYALNSDNTDSGLIFGISPCPNLHQISNGNQLGYADNPSAAPSDYSVFCLTTTNPTTSHANAVCVPLGSFRMTKNASDDWTVAALNQYDGIGLWDESFEFVFPQNQMGAASSSYLMANGGTPPAFTTNEFYYYLKRDGTCKFIINLNGDAGTDGSGAVQTKIALPYRCDEGIDQTFPCFLQLPSKTYNPALATLDSGGANLKIDVQSDTAGALQASTTNITHAAFSNGSRRIYITGQYLAFLSS